MSRQRVVAIGGGHGLARALESLCAIGAEPTAVVTVADDGGSSGRLRADLDVIAPGDLRMALLAMARNHDLAAALAHRFAHGELEGHALGNLLLVGLAEQLGGFVPALDAAAKLLDCAGRALPSTTQSVGLHAKVGDVRIDGQRHIARARGGVRSLWLSPPAPNACEEAVEAIATADTVMLGPGSLYTSVIANLLVPGIADAVAATPARLVYVSNLRTQPGETLGMDAAAHVEALRSHLGGRRLDTVVLHDGPVAADGGATPLGTDVPDDVAHEVIRVDLSEHVDGRVTAAHDLDRLSAVLADVLSSREVDTASA